MDDSLRVLADVIRPDRRLERAHERRVTLAFRIGQPGLANAQRRRVSDHRSRRDRGGGDGPTIKSNLFAAEQLDIDVGENLNVEERTMLVMPLDLLRYDDTARRRISFFDRSASKANLRMYHQYRTVTPIAEEPIIRIDVHSAMPNALVPPTPSRRDYE